MIAQAESTLATLVLIQGNYEEAERLAQHSVDVYRAVHGADHPEVAPRLAVLATVAGLFVAIPALFGYNYLLTRNKAVTANMQVFVDEFVTRLAELHRDADSGAAA